MTFAEYWDRKRRRRRIIDMGHVRTGSHVTSMRRRVPGGIVCIGGLESKGVWVI